MSECAGEDCQHPDCGGRLRRDPVVKYDGSGHPVRASELGGNRTERRAAAREARRGAR